MSDKRIKFNDTWYDLSPIQDGKPPSQGITGWWTDNKKAILGWGGAILAGIAFVISKVPALTTQWPTAVAVVSAIIGFIGFTGMGAAHASAPATADVIAAVTAPPTPIVPTSSQSLLYGPVSSGPEQTTSKEPLVHEV